MTTTPRRIPFEQPEAALALFNEVQGDFLRFSYQPTYRDNDLALEGGTTDSTASNLAFILGREGRPKAVRIGCGLVLFAFERGAYVASGFSWGYGGTGPTGFARFLAQAGIMQFDEAKRRIAGLHEKASGDLLELFFPPFADAT